jgi:hypothetical protein
MTRYSFASEAACGQVMEERHPRDSLLNLSGFLKFLIKRRNYSKRHFKQAVSVGCFMKLRACQHFEASVCLTALIEAHLQPY